MASTSPELERFVHEAMARGQTRAAIRQALASAGWSEEQTRGVLDGYAEVDFPVPVPRPRASLSAKEAFQYLVLFATLYFSAYHLGSLLFDLVNRAIPDPAARTLSIFGDSMRFSFAALLISFPVFAWMSRLLARDVARNPIKRLSPVRRWLTYLTLFVAAGILIGDMTALVYNLLGGETTPRFLAKVVVVAVIAGGIFHYYLRDLRREEDGSGSGPASGRNMLVLASVIVIASVVAGLLTMESPLKQRDRRLDMRRVQDLNAIDRAMDTWATDHGSLPASLAELAGEPGASLSIADPVDGVPYGYSVLSPSKFRLCAVFSTSTSDRGPDARRFGWYDDEWKHPVGRQCFERMLGQAAAATVSAKAANAARP